MIKREISGGKTKTGTPFVLQVRQYDDGRRSLGSIHVGQDFIDVSVNGVKPTRFLKVIENFSMQRKEFSAPRGTTYEFTVEVFADLIASQH